MAVDEQVAVGPAAPYRNWTRDRGVTAVLLVVAAVGWWWSVQAMQHDSMSGPGGMSMSGGMSPDEGMTGHSGMLAMSLGAFLVAWVAMMAAMMLPAVAPVVGLYRRSVAAGRAAPLPVFIAGYLLVWAVPGLPVYWAWDRLAGPLADGAPWAGRLAAGALLAAAAWQVGPVKALCLKHCRSPLSFFLRYGDGLRRPGTAFQLGVRHGGFCFGCCWLLMVVLVALGTMNLAWMAALAVVIFVEKTATSGEWFSRVTAVALAALGAFLLIDPTAVASIT